MGASNSRSILPVCSHIGAFIPTTRLCNLGCELRLRACRKCAQCERYVRFWPANIFQSVLASAEQGTEEPHFDFIGIHNLAKHVIYLRESSHAAWATANHICERHYRLLVQQEKSQQAHLTQSIHTLLQHKLGLFEVCKLRVETLDSRLKNTINLVSCQFPLRSIR